MLKPYKDYWALPGDLVQPKESIDRAVDRVLKDLTGLNNIYTEQVKTFGDVGRHPLGRVFTISHYSLLKADQYALNPSSFAVEAKWHNVRRLGELAFDHNKIFAACKEKLVKSVQSKPIGFELLPENFTLSITKPVRSNFRKKF